MQIYNLIFDLANLIFIKSIFFLNLQIFKNLIFLLFSFFVPRPTYLLAIQVLHNIQHLQFQLLPILYYELKGVGLRMNNTQKNYVILKRLELLTPDSNSDVLPITLQDNFGSCNGFEPIPCRITTYDSTS